MRDINLKNSNELVLLALVTNSTVDQVKTTIYSSLLSDGFIYGDQEDCGIALSELLEQSNYSVQEFVNDVYGEENAFNSKIVNLLNPMTFIHSIGECPLCGYSLEITEDSYIDGKTSWTNTKCENSVCEYSISNEPDHMILCDR